MSMAKSEHFVRAAEARTALGAVEGRRSVTLTGPQGSGRSTTIREISNALQDAGRSVLMLRGTRAMQERPLAVLNLEGSLTPREARSDVGIAVFAEELTQRVKARPSTVFLLDDADLLDPTTWAVLSAVHQRTGVPIVATAERRAGDRGDPAGLYSAGVHHLRIRLAPLRHDGVSDLLHGVLGGNVDPQLVSRIYIASGGNAGLVVALAHSASENGSLQLSRGSWIADGPLVSDGLRIQIDAALGRLSADEIEAVETLALAGTVDSGTAYRLIDETLLETLETRELITSLVVAGETMIAVNPPLLSDHFRFRPGSGRRVRLREHVQTTRALVEHERAAEARERAADFAWPEADATVPAFTRFVQEQRQARARDLMAVWRSSPTPQAAVPLLRVLFSHGEAADPLIAEVFESTPKPADLSEDNVILRQFNAQWLAFKPNGLDDALKLLESSTRELPGAALSFACLALQLEARFTALPVDLDDRFAALVDRGAAALPEFQVVRAYCELVRGDFQTAEHALDQIPADLGGDLGTYARALRGLALYEAGRLEEAMEWARRATDGARASLDTGALRMHYYVTLMSLLQQGRMRDAERVLEDIFALGSPGVTDALQHLSSLVIGAYVAARSGRVQAAESLSEQAGKLTVQVGPLPGMDRSWALAHLLSVTGQRQEAARLFRDSARTLHERGYRFAANFAAISALEVEPQLDLALETEQSVLEQGGGVQLPLAQYHVASAHGDPEALEAAAERLLESGQHAVAAAALLRATKLLRDRDENDRAALLQDRARQLVESEGLPLISAVSEVSRERENLTAREREIAELAAAGHSNLDIADRLGIGGRTVESHLGRVFQKLGVNKRSDLSLFLIDGS